MWYYFWFIIPADYGTESADGKSDGAVDAGDAHSGDIKLSPPSPANPASEESAETDENLVNNGQPTIEIPTDEQAPPQVNRNDCSNNNGGCQHICNMVATIDEMVVQCSCKSGYYLDTSNAQACIGEWEFVIIVFNSTHCETTAKGTAKMTPEGFGLCFFYWG